MDVTGRVCTEIVWYRCYMQGTQRKRGDAWKPYADHEKKRVDIWTSFHRTSSYVQSSMPVILVA